MPTTRPRHTVTESDEVRAALEVAARRWPGTPRGRLLTRLLAAGARAIEQDGQVARDRRLDAIERAAGSLGGVYRPDELARLREDWPE